MLPAFLLHPLAEFHIFALLQDLELPIGITVCDLTRALQSAERWAPSLYDLFIPTEVCV